MAKGSAGLKSFIALVGRVCLSLMFIIAGIQRIMHYKMMSAMLTQMGSPTAYWWLILAIVFELGGGALIFLGLFARFGAFLLLVFVVIATFLFHSFWSWEGVQTINQMPYFLNNLTVLGGILYVLAYGAGCCSFDALRHRSSE